VFAYSSSYSTFGAVDISVISEGFRSVIFFSCDE
jgi:hypothetical protein